MLDLSQAPNYIQGFAGIRLGRARDILLYHRWCYYIQDRPEIPDTMYDHIEWFFRYLFPEDPVINGIGSSRICDYPMHIRECRRPNELERIEYGGY